MGTPGKTAPLLLQDLHTYDPRYEDLAGRNLLTSPRPPFDHNTKPMPAIPKENCLHEFELKHEQSELPSHVVDLDRPPVYRIASFCRRCRWHFDIVVDCRDNGTRNSLCGHSNQDFPLHHLLFQGQSDENSDFSLGNQPRLMAFKFTCSAPKCPVDVQLRVFPPHFSDQDILLLTNRANLRRRWEASKQISGERADTTMARPVDALDYLNTYLQDSMNPQKGKTRVPLLNKKFLKTFGKDCDDILVRLGFTKSLEEEDDGTSVEVWHLPKPPPAQSALESLEPTLRNDIENARYELNAIILRYPSAERLGARHVPMKSEPSSTLMQQALGCDTYDRRAERTRSSGTNREEDHPHFAGLGALADFSDNLLLFAYGRQVDVHPEGLPYYFECLKGIAVGRASETLQDAAATLASQGVSDRQGVNDAYLYLNINPAHASVLTDAMIINVFQTRIPDMGLAAVAQSRVALRTIGITRNSEAIKRVASDTIETYQQAIEWLDLDDANSNDEFIIAMYTLKTNDNPSSIETARKAVQIVADHRKSQALWDYLSTGQVGEAEMDTADAYNILNLQDRSAKLDLAVVQTQVAVHIQADPANEEKYRRAQELVRKDQEQSFGQSVGYQDRPSVNYPLATWPVGCCNIGNTCYLNSVLQFLFTIKPLRDKVLDCDAHLQDLSPELLELKRVGRTAVSRARAETGQKFVKELRSLFERMIREPDYFVRPERSLAALALTRTESINDLANHGTQDDGSVSRLGKIGDLPISGPMLPPDLENAGLPTPADSVMGDYDADGDTDSMKAMDRTETLEDLNETSTVKPEPPSRPPPVPPRPQSATDIGLKQLEDVAQQQDAAEILNNVFDLLSCAFEGDAPTLRDGEQSDFVKRLFFSDVTTVRKTIDKDIPKTDLQDNILVSTKDRDRTLCAALDDEFGLTELDDGITKYEYFEEAAPIQIINVRRLQFENGQPRKDESHLFLDKVMYMDRYLKATKSLSEEQLQELRNQQWGLQSELRCLEARRKLLNETDFKDVDLPDALDEAASLIDSLHEHAPDLNISFDQVEAEEVSCHLKQRADELRPEVAELHDRMNRLESQIDSVFENCKDHPYRLHAIFMHAGSSRGGHYWIYIYDSQNNIWRKYNDESVTEVSEENILKKLEQDRPPTSTGIVYVREDMVNEYTEAVHRIPDQVNGSPDADMRDADGAAEDDIVSMDDIARFGVIDGVENDDFVVGHFNNDWDDLDDAALKLEREIEELLAKKKALQARTKAYAAEISACSVLLEKPRTKRCPEEPERRLSGSPGKKGKFKRL